MNSIPSTSLPVLMDMMKTQIATGIEVSIRQVDIVVIMVLVTIF